MLQLVESALSVYTDMLNVFVIWKSCFINLFQRGYKFLYLNKLGSMLAIRMIPVIKYFTF